MGAGICGHCRAAVLLALLALAAAAPCRPAAAEEEAATTLEVTVSNVRNSRGHIRVAVCTQETFLGPSCPFNGSAPARPGSVTVTVAGVPPGLYAVQVFQDEDDSGHIRRSLLGIPQEGVGFSNDASMRFGAPRFPDAAFRLAPAGGRLSLRLKYFD